MRRRAAPTGALKNYSASLDSFSFPEEEPINAEGTVNHLPEAAQYQEGMTTGCYGNTCDVQEVV